MGVTRTGHPASGSGQSWRTRATCIGLPTEIFFSDDPSDIATAKAACAVCPVLDDCLDFALQHRESGVWGGSTEQERERVRRQRRQRGRPAAG